MSTDESTPLSSGAPPRRGLLPTIRIHTNEVDLIQPGGRHHATMNKNAKPDLESHTEEGSGSKPQTVSLAQKVGVNYTKIFAQVAAANNTLPLISTLSLCACLSYYNYYTPVYVTLNSSTEVGRAAQFIYILAASISASCAVYATVFFVLEGYYLNLAINSDDMNQSMVNAKFINDQEAYELRCQLAEDIEKNWEYFTPQRSWARNCLWICLSLLFVSASCELVVDAGAVSYLAIAGMVLMASGILAIWMLVFKFRDAYRPVLARAQGVDERRV